MWKVLLFLAVPLVPLAAAHSGGDDRKARDTEVQCLIRAEGAGSGVQLEGVAITKQQLAGTYEFDVRKTGRAGTSNSAQSGAFETRRGEAVLGQVGLGLERGASYEAKLVMRWDDGETSCVARGPSAEKGAKR
jgi:hypothetical protein